MIFEHIPLYAMLVSLTAMIIQLIFGVMGIKRATAETNRQIAETKKQEVLLAIQTEETYKTEVRQWGREVINAMAQGQQLCTVDPKSLKNSDFSIERAKTVGELRSLLNRARWLFPNLAIPSREDDNFEFKPDRNHSALESILYAYLALEQCDPRNPDQRTETRRQIDKFRNEFVSEMRKAVDPQVRGEDIERLVAELHSAQVKAAEAKADAEAEEEEA